MPTNRTQQKRMPILGVPIDDVTEDEVIERIAAWIEEGEPHQICTVNPELL